MATHSWINRVTGESVKPDKKGSLLTQVIGEAINEPVEDIVDAPEPAPEPVESEELNAPGIGPEELEPPVEDVEGTEYGADSQIVRHLVNSWNGGSKMDVAAQLLYTPISYVDFLTMAHRVGEEASYELGTILDELADQREDPNVPEQIDAESDGAERILSRIAQRGHRSANAMSAAAGDSAPSQDQTP